MCVCMHLSVLLNVKSAAPPLTKDDNLYPWSIRDVPTDAVFLLDEAIEVISDEVESAFDVWCHHQDQIVGFYPLFHHWDEMQGKWQLSSEVVHNYSLIHTRAAMILKSVVFATHIYTCHAFTTCTYVCTNMYKCTLIWTHTNIHTHVHTHSHTHVHTHTHTCARTHSHTRTHVHSRAYTHMYTHTRTYTISSTILFNFLKVLHPSLATLVRIPPLSIEITSSMRRRTLQHPSLIYCA